MTTAPQVVEMVPAESPVPEQSQRPEKTPFQKKIDRLCWERGQAQREAEALRRERDYLAGENLELGQLLVTYQDQVERLITELRRARGR